MAGESAADTSSAERSAVAGASVVALALALRAWVAYRRELIFDDGPIFLRSAELFLAGDFGAALAQPYHPLTSLLIAACSFLTGLGVYASGMVIAVISGGVAAGALYLLTRDMFGPRVAWVAGLLFAVEPRMVAAASNVQSDGTHVALFLVGALLAWRALVQGRFALGLAAGVASGLAYLARPEGMAIGVVLGLWVAAGWISGRYPRAQLARAAAGFAAAALLLGGPYVLALKAVSGDWVLTQKKRVIPAELALPSAQQLGSAVWEVTRDAHRGNEVIWILTLLAFRPRRPSRRTLYLLSYLALFFVVLLGVHLEAGYISRRHWLCPLALLIPFSAQGVLRVSYSLARQISRESFRRWAVPLCVSALIVPLAAHEMMRRSDPLKLARKEAALWLSEQNVQGLIAPRQRDAYYAGTQDFVYLWHIEDTPALQHEMEKSGLNFALGEEERLPWPPTVRGHRLREVHRVPSPEGDVVVLQLDALPNVAAEAP